MRKLVAFIVVVSFLIIYIPGFCREDGEKEASTRAYEQASEQSIFHRISDWFVTIGKSKEEKEAIISELRAKRTQARIQKEAEKTQRKAERETR